MPILARKQKQGILVPAGNHQAVCYDVWDIGLQKIEFKGKEMLKYQIVIAWEVNKVITVGEHAGKRFSISRKYTNSLGKKARLHKDIKSWRGKAFTKEELDNFDLEKLVGQNCFLNIVHSDPNTDGKVYSNVESIAQVPEGIQLLTPENRRTTPDWIKDLQSSGFRNEAEQEEAEAGSSLEDPE
jgi:hypothetical protein